MIVDFSRRVLGGCQVIARDSDATRILQLDSSGCSNLKQHSDEIFVFADWALHVGFRYIAAPYTETACWQLDVSLAIRPPSAREKRSCEDLDLHIT